MLVSFLIPYSSPCDKLLLHVRLHHIMACTPRTPVAYAPAVWSAWLFKPPMLRWDNNTTNQKPGKIWPIGELGKTSTQTIWLYDLRYLVPKVKICKEFFKFLHFNQLAEIQIFQCYWVKLCLLRFQLEKIKKGYKRIVQKENSKIIVGAFR